jgi:rhodanese-related sulfurtransferase/DNA-binding transcriptional ArsR family regulator
MIEYLIMNDRTKREFKDQVFEQFSRIGKALSSGRRLELLELLAQGEKTVENVAEETGMSVANTSRHLQALRQANLVAVRRDGLFAFYSLADPCVVALWRALRSVGEHQLAEIERVVSSYLKDRSSLIPVNCEQLNEWIKKNEVVVLDVRPHEEFKAGHISGARSVPVRELKNRLKELTRRKTVVAYCRGPYCVFADEAVSILKAAGFRALRLDQGLPDWQAQGYPLA